MRINGKCNNSHTPSTGLSGILLSVRKGTFMYTHNFDIDYLHLKSYGEYVFKHIMSENLLSRV